MKHILILAALLAAVACGQKKAESKALVLYYSQTGTTKAVAEALQQQLGADIEEIVAVNSYGEDFGATIARGQKELQEGTLPEIQPIQADIASYDVIFLGYPVWFGTYANPIATILDQAPSAAADWKRVSPPSGRNSLRPRSFRVTVSVPPVSTRLPLKSSAS